MIGAEFVGTSISSGGDGNDRNAVDTLGADNPHLKWQNNRRGYVSCTVTADEWRAEYRTVQFVTRPDAPIATPTKWVLRNGQPGISRD